MPDFKDTCQRAIALLHDPSESVKHEASPKKREYWLLINLWGTRLSQR